MPTKAILRHMHVETPRTDHQRKCAAHRSGSKAHKLLSGDIHLVVTENDKTYRYCSAAAKDILDKAQSDLDYLRQQLGL